jgi:hypothetical protein
MRDDLLDIVLDQSSATGFQRDKFEDYHRRLAWKQFELRNFIESRVRKIFKMKYTGDDVSLDDLFEDSRTGFDHFSYICDRTMMRPRDILAYFNMIFDRCGGKSKISLKDIRSLELDYSKSRRQALVDEWREYLPFVDEIVGFLGHKKLSATFRLGAVAKEAIDHVATQLYAENQHSDYVVVRYAKAHFEDNSEASQQAFLFRIIESLYRIGAIGLRTQENSRPQFSFISKPSISIEELGENTWCIVHPMLWQNLGRRSEMKNLFAEF